MTTGYEPKLSKKMQQNSRWRISSRRLGNFLANLAPDAASAATLRAAIHDSDFYTRLTAAQLLSERGDREARLVIEDALQNGHAPSRAIAARYLHGFTWFAAQPLIEMALQDDDPRVREGGILSLCKFRTMDAYNRILDALEYETDDSVLGAPATPWGLQNTTDPLVVPVLTLGFKAEDPKIRVEVTEALSSTELATAIPVMREVLTTDPDPEVVYQAALSYVELAEDDAIADFATILSALEGLRQLSALRGFFHASNYRHLNIGNNPAADALIDALARIMESPHADIRRQAIWILAWMKHERAPGLVIDFYQRETDIDLKAHIMRVAVSLMMVDSEALLEDALASSDTTMRQAGQRIVMERQQQVAV